MKAIDMAGPLDTAYHRLIDAPDIFEPWRRLVRQQFYRAHHGGDTDAMFHWFSEALYGTAWLPRPPLLVRLWRRLRGWA